MKLIATREIPLKDIIPCSLLYEREDLGNLNEITGDIFTPIIVRPSKTQPGKFERIAGLRRFKKAEKDGKKTILCAIYEMTDEEAILVNAKENLQRKDLNPIEEGKGYRNILQTLKITQEKLAKELKKGGIKRSQEHISNRMRLLNLAEPVQVYLALNKLSVYQGLLLLGIKDENLQIEMAKQCVNNKYTTRQLEEKIVELKERLEGYRYYGQTSFIEDNKNEGLKLILPIPETIQPYKKPKPIKLIRMYPDCSEVIEKLYEIFRVYWRKAGLGQCSDCPLNPVCVKVSEYEPEFEPFVPKKKKLELINKEKKDAKKIKLEFEDKEEDTD